ncbi:tungsten ABC transporter substrate-binding protein [Iocasia frigidifontis]|uniref:Tungsten ABC transporter substrate-binding protein n=2 Tax=Iocasia fonsfrigidae TaxID=2682810 RepID=A0A8A7KF57_9FIRM|nr:tungsten ABC transporter substrate-binding protein [Iocasia fonsfrigidae]
MTLVFVLVCLMALVVVGYVSGVKDQRLIMATTTSTDNSGLLDQLIPAFEKGRNIRVDVVAVGTGKALELGRNGDADVLLVHAKSAELEFIDNGYGVNRQEVMYNDFIVLGPKDDPANIKGNSDALAVFKKIAAAEAAFVSRGDDSGTNKKELSIWKEAGIEPQGSWYQETGQGMGASLTIANEKQAYILADRGTYLAYKDKIELEILSEGDPLFFNLYGVMAVNPEKHEGINYDGAMEFIEFIMSKKGQEIIRDFTVSGERLFNPLNL